MEPTHKSELICYICIILIIILSAIISLTYSDSVDPSKKSYSLMFDDSSTTFQHEEGGVTFVIDDFDQAGDKTMSISDLVDNTVGNDYSIYASEFSNGRQLIDLDIKFDNQQLGSFHTSNGKSTQIEISVNKQFKLGEYHGWFILPGPNGFSIPITLSTPPVVLPSMLIIIIGALTSIIVIEVTRLADFYIQEKVSNDITIMADPRVAAVVNYKINFFKERYSGITTIIKQTLLSFLPAMFALGLALFAFINNEMVTTVLELNFENVVGLFLLGAGIESIKELFNRTNV